MTSWQKWARLGVLVFGIAVGVVVYLGMGERVRPVVAQPVKRFDANATVETAAGFVQRLEGSESKFEVKFDRSLAYDDNTLRMFKVRIVPPLRGGRQYLVSANEGLSGQQQRVLQLAGDVRVEASDGFRMTTEAGTFNQDDAIAKAPGAVMFGRGRMSGSGQDVSYDTNADVLVILKDPHVVTTAEDGGTILEFTAGSATLDRAQHLLTLDGMVHILKGEQTFDSDRAVAFLNDGNDVVTRIEMRGNSRVSGESKGVAGMSARDIDLDYTDDGATLETAALQGTATLATPGQNGTPGRQMSGERLELTLDPDGYLTKAVGTGASGRDRVTLVLPADDDVPSRTIRARHLDATGLPGQGLNSVRFTDEVEFLEPAVKPGATDRIVRANVLQTTMVDDRVTGAFFTGSARFEERGLLATAPTMNYVPDQSRVELRDADAKGGPHIEDERMVTDAGEITVTLSPRQVRAGKGVRTTLRPPRDKPGAKPTSGSRLPGVFKQDEAAAVTSWELEYSGESGRTVYVGNPTRRATILQGPNTIVADRLELDQDTGDLVALGNANTRLGLASGESAGVAREIRFDNEQRTIRYASVPGSAAPARGGRNAAAAGPTRGAARGAAVSAPAAPAASSLAGPPLARLNGGEGDLQGETIVVMLAAAENRVEQVEVTSNVLLVLDRERKATGDYLVYRTATEEYELTGTAPTMVKLIERRSVDCYESTGRRLTYHRPTSTMRIDGRSETLASVSRNPCATTPAR